MDKPVQTAKDPVKERLKAQGQGAKLTQKEMEATLLDLLEKIGVE